MGSRIGFASRFKGPGVQACASGHSHLVTRIMAFEFRCVVHQANPLAGVTYEARKVIAQLGMGRDQG